MSETNNLPIEVDIVSGFLGAGKTTLIRQLIDEGLYADKLIVLENEFGVINIDSETLSATGVEVESIIASCICCSGADTLVDKLAGIAAAHAPRKLLVEPTGVARLSDVRRVFQYPMVRSLYRLNKVVTVVDALNYSVWMKVSKEFFYDQIRFSDFIYVSKVEESQPEQVAELMDLLGKISPDCPVFTNIQILLDVWRTGFEKGVHQPVYSVLGKHGGNFESIAIEFSTRLDCNALLQLLNKAQGGEFGNIYRIKGGFQDETGAGFTLHWVGDRYQLIPSGDDVVLSPSLCIIGCNLDRDSLYREFELIKYE